MPKKMNKKGMTLIEIVIVMAIVSLLMAVTAGFIVSSLGYLNDATVSDTDKQGLDGILDYVNSQINYATQVKVSNNKPSTDYDWQYFTVQGGKLYHGDDSSSEEVFDSGYYYNRYLKITVQVSDNNYRLDMKLNYLDGTKASAPINTRDSVYHTSKTFEFPSVISDYAKESTLIALSETKREDNGSITSYPDVKIWYTSDVPNTSSPSTVSSTNTVAEQIKMLNVYNNMGTYDSDNGYKRGDFVYYNNQYWMYVSDPQHNYGNGTASPGTGLSFKSISSTYNAYSAYEVGDVVFNEVDQSYYKCGTQIDYQDWSGAAQPPLASNSRWTKLTGTDLVNGEPAKDFYDYSSSPSMNLTYREATVMKYYDEAKSKAVEWSNANKSDANVRYVCVKVTDPEIPSNYPNKEKYYRRIFVTDKQPGTTASSGWELLDATYSPTSSYAKDDIVFGKGVTGAYNNTLGMYIYVKAKDVINVDNNGESEPASSNWGKHWKNIE